MGTVRDRDCAHTSTTWTETIYVTTEITVIVQILTMFSRSSHAVLALDKWKWTSAISILADTKKASHAMRSQFVCEKFRAKFGVLRQAQITVDRIGSAWKEGIEERRRERARWVEDKKERAYHASLEPTMEMSEWIFEGEKKLEWKVDESHSNQKNQCQMKLLMEVWAFSLLNSNFDSFSTRRRLAALELFETSSKNIGREMINIDWTEMITLLTTQLSQVEAWKGPESQSECRQTWVQCWFLIFSTKRARCSLKKADNTPRHSRHRACVFN